MNTKQTNKLASHAAVEAALQAEPEIASVAGLPEKLAVPSARMVAPLRRTHVGFYAAYRAARSIVDWRGRRRRPAPVGPAEASAGVSTDRVAA